ncbi:mannitol dehydrogenase family protein [Glycomyces albus]
MTGDEAPRLGRGAGPGATAPMRIVHLGLGAFHRAHQAWYTARAADAADWGIAAFTGRSSRTATLMAEQDCVYTLVERTPDGDRCEAVGSIVHASPGDEVESFAAAVANPAVAVLTLTVTEAGYRLDAGGEPDMRDPEVRGDAAVLRSLARGEAAPTARPRTALGRVLWALDRRHRAGAPPLAVVPCDNLPDNGATVQRALELLADEVAPGRAEAVRRTAAFVSTSVDRITPRTGPADIAAVTAATGRHDAVPVVTEPFSDWVLCGEFPSGRPAWETAGARFTDDLAPWEARKLWLLNGAHTLLAATGPRRGHRTVAEAIADPVCRARTEALWDEAERHLPDLGLRRYRSDLIERFANPRIEHRLDQIAEDALTKLRLRIAPVALAERAAGRSAAASAEAIAAWALANCGRPGHPATASALLERLSPDLAADADFAATVLCAVRSPSTL